MFINFFSYFMEYCGIGDVIVNSNKLSSSSIEVFIQLTTLFIYICLQKNIGYNRHGSAA